jgi:hypothetical protein
MKTAATQVFATIDTAAKPDRRRVELPCGLHEHQQQRRYAARQPGGFFRHPEIELVHDLPEGLALGRHLDATGPGRCRATVRRATDGQQLQRRYGHRSAAVFLPEELHPSRDRRLLERQCRLQARWQHPGRQPGTGRIRVPTGTAGAQSFRRRPATCTPGPQHRCAEGVQHASLQGDLFDLDQEVDDRRQHGPEQLHVQLHQFPEDAGLRLRGTAIVARRPRSR